MVYEDADDHIVDALRQALHVALPSFEVEMGRGSSTQAVTAVQHADVDCAIAGAPRIYVASVGGLDGMRFDRLRGVAVLQPRLIHLLVNKEAGIEHIQDLRGRKIGVTPSESVTPSLSSEILRVFGLRHNDVDIVVLSVEENMAQLASGSLDAAFVLGPYPLEAVKIATHRGARLLELSEPAIDNLRHRDPFLRPFEIPEGMYQADAVRTIGFNLVLICRNDLDQSVVYASTEALFDAMPALSARDESFRYVDVERAPATPIALHLGAARYYREQQLAR